MPLFLSDEVPATISPFNAPHLWGVGVEMETGYQETNLCTYQLLSKIKQVRFCHSRVVADNENSWVLVSCIDELKLYAVPKNSHVSAERGGRGEGAARTSTLTINRTSPSTPLSLIFGGKNCPGSKLCRSCGPPAKSPNLREKNGPFETPNSRR